jgi:hypothetical protein
VLASGAAEGTTVACGAGPDACTGDPVGSLRTVPSTRRAWGSSPFMYAIWATGMRLWAARPLSVSPARTL